jgi:hypothetical protein
MTESHSIDIICPGHLPDSLSIDDIRHGKTNSRLQQCRLTVQGKALLKHPSPNAKETPWS